MKKMTALLIAVFTAIFCCTSCGSPKNDEPAGTSPEIASDQGTAEAPSGTADAEVTTAKSTETTTAKATTTAENTTAAKTTEEVTTQPRENAAPFGDFYDVGYCGDAVSGNSETLIFSVDNSTYSFGYANKYNREKSIRLAEFFNRCSYPDYTVGSTGGDTPPWIQTGSNDVSSIRFMAKDGKEMRFISFDSDTSCLTYVRSAYEEEAGASNSKSLTLISPEVHRYSIDFEFMRSNIVSILGSDAVSSVSSFSLFNDSDLYFNFSPYYHPENMTLYPENADDPFGAFSIPNSGAFKLETNTAEAINILNRRTYSKITNAGEIPTAANGSDIEKFYMISGKHPSVAAKSDRTYDHVIIMCSSDKGYYVISILSGKSTVLSYARYEFRTEGDRKICTNMDEVKSGRNIEWFRCDGDLAGEIRNAVSPEADK